MSKIGELIVRKLSQTFRKIKMSSTRYFPNTLSDFQASESNLQIPEDALKASVKNITENIENSLQPTERNGRDGLYLGTAGIAYMYYHLSKTPALSDHKHNFLTKALEYLEPALNAAKSRNPRDTPSFILGNCGVYAIATVIYKATSDNTKSERYRKLYSDAAHICKTLDFLQCGSDELFVGRAGYIFGALWIAKETGVPLPKNDIFTLCNLIIESGKKYAQSRQSPCPLMYAYYKVEYLGAAHGLCTILQALLSVPEFLDSNPKHVIDVKVSIDYLLSLQDNEGNFPCATDEIGSGPNKLVHWCHGAGGMVYLMAKAYLTWKEDKYLESCHRMAELIWKKGLLKKGPGICHGIAGNGYAFLLLYRITGKPVYLHRAIAFAEFMNSEQFTTEARTPDYPFSLYEGLAGTNCYLADVTNPQQAAFPFSEVFNH